MNILLTGFNRFGDLEFNPSEAIVNRCAAWARGAGGVNLVAEVLSTEFEAAGERMRSLIRSVRPDLVVSLGVAARACGLRLERVALNLDDSPAPDNAGVPVTGRRIVPDGPVGYWSTLPLEDLKRALEAREIPVQISNHAGTFVCNHVFYVARHEIERLGIDARCGFVHVPLMTEQVTAMEADLPSLPLAMLVDAVQCCLDLLVQNVPNLAR
ncbi:MAG: hypothetical protein JXA93_15465 [Anaerolineae bacterium]|nr:hypothetical protein [Anaerolineae bacterium]